MAYRALQSRYPHVFTEHSKPVWVTLAPVVGYSGARRLSYRAKGKDPWDEEGKEKLLSRDTAIKQADKWDKEMTPTKPSASTK